MSFGDIIPGVCTQTCNVSYSDGVKTKTLIYHWMASDGRKILLSSIGNRYPSEADLIRHPEMIVGRNDSN